MTLAATQAKIPASASIESTPALRVAYLINQYPQPSHSFIRREIAALETLGHTVQRYTLRRVDTLVDPVDQREAERTRCVLQAGPLALLAACLRLLCTQPRTAFRTLRLAMQMGRRSDRGVMRHLIYFVEACYLVRQWRAERIGHVHAHFGTNSTCVAMFGYLLGGPTYSFTAHGPEEFDKPEFLHLGEKIAHAAFVVAISDFGRSQLYRQCPYEQWGKIQVVRCGVDAAYLTQPLTPPATAPRLVCIARLHEQKGLPLLLQAAAEVVASGHELELILVGDGPLRATLERLTRQLQLEKHVHFAGWQSGDEVRALLTNARALVLPSFAEGLPVVLMEALALGRPVLSTYVAGIVELVEPGVCGWLVPPGSSATLAAGLEQVLAASPAELAAQGAAGARRVAEKHDVRQSARQLSQLLAAVDNTI